ncbi:MAG: arabinofuranosyltransferase [Verrucomicrobiota bacterium]
MKPVSTTRKQKSVAGTSRNLLLPSETLSCLVKGLSAFGDGVTVQTCPMTQIATRKEKIALAVISVAVAIAVYYGWRLFWFLTDDAFIAFRYISNGHLGYGYVWNAPPFRPVEGYTSFLWVVLLDAVWRITGVEPPAAANNIALFFTYLTLLLGGLMVLKMKLGERLRKYRLLFLCLVFVGVITNRTFLAWTSSGLETAMFNFFLTLWIYCCLFRENRGRRWMVWLSLTTALLCLTRPDGLLFAMATIALFAKEFWEARTATSSRTAFARLAPGALPLLIIPAHILWRHSVYGSWLPNTYYAKAIAGRWWYGSGLRYLACFVLEYALWIWLLVVLVALLVALLRIKSFRKLAQLPVTRALVILTVVGHVAYYTIIIGGDHFEYRVFSQLILLIFITFLWALSNLGLSVKIAGPLFAVFIILSWPIPWIHWGATHNLSLRRQTFYLTGSVARVLQKEVPWTPVFVLRYISLFDRMQYWLIERSVCMRHQEHKIFYFYQTQILPPREEGMSLPATGYPVTPATSVGVIAWVLPKVNIIDTMGLNDYVVARNPQLRMPAQLAHDRQPPKGYVECFSPNMAFSPKHAAIKQRPVELTAEKIVQCEQQYAALVTQGVPVMQSPTPTAAASPAVPSATPSPGEQ